AANPGSAAASQCWSKSFFSPPPCGEGLGVGVVRGYSDGNAKRRAAHLGAARSLESTAAARARARDARSTHGSRTKALVAPAPPYFVRQHSFSAAGSYRALHRRLCKSQGQTDYRN